jgi:hypothetical protein
MGLIGVLVETNVGALPLRKATEERCKQGPSYVIRPAEAGVCGCITLPALPHAVLADSIVEALIAYADPLLTPLVQLEIPQDEELARELEQARLAAEKIETQCKAPHRQSDRVQRRRSAPYPGRRA